VNTDQEIREGIQCVIHGRVQGVFFRVSTQETALQLGLTGWVRNRIDGTVELLACGDVAKLSRFRAWLEMGPEMANVSKVDCKPAEGDAMTGFKIT